VIDKYEWTYDSEETEEFLRSLVKADRATSTPLEAFKIPKVRAIFDQRLWAAGYSEHLPQGPELRQCHDVAARLVDMCFRSLADAGYGLESKKKFRSAIHDVTHSIYALAADIFVSGDQRMLGKAKATYKFLEAECRVMSPEELVVFVANPNSN
jgi:hypothetical protein